MRNIEREISLIRRKSMEMDKSLKRDQGSLENLSDRLVKKIAGNMLKPTGQMEKEIEELTDQVKELRNKIELTPKILEELKNKIALLEKERADLILKRKIEEQKEIGVELARVSESFIKNLKLVLKENSEIQSLWVGFKKLQETTGYSKFERKVSIGSGEMLGIVAGILVGEYEKNIIRKQSVFNRIRL